MGLIAFLLAPKFPDHQNITTFIFYFSIAAVFMAHILIDLEHHLLFDKLNIYLLLVITPYAILNYAPMYWLLGGLIGFLGPLGISILFYKFKNQEGLGGGDIKLFGILGIILGPIGILNNIFMSCTLGAVVGVVLIALKKMEKDTAFAFGPFILIVATIQIYFPSVVELINPFSF
jgi:leader peptidase (prepilin peptidase)/N-methyltransferase